MKKIYLKSKSDNERLDVYIFNELKSLGYKDISRSKLQKLIKSSDILVNRCKSKSNYILKINDEIEVMLNEEENKDIKAEDINIDIVYQDEYLAIINKPQGMVVHPGDGNWSGTLVNGLIYHLDKLSDFNEDHIRPGIVHRIDKDTSGLLIVAKTNFAHESLAKQLEEHTVVRKYITLVEGNFKEEFGTIDFPISRNPKDRKKMSVVDGGRKAITHFKVLKRYRGYTLLEAKLETGRTHQIRVHMNYIKHPIVGDATYGSRKQKFKLDGQLLHAKTVGFIHPHSKEYMEFNAPIPDYFKNVLNKLDINN